tara:strand:- start:1694 stop:1873 length:180 start_codon:yes stop_codon:yes gene_type:complete
MEEEMKIDIRPIEARMLRHAIRELNIALEEIEDDGPGFFSIQEMGALELVRMKLEKAEE